MNKKQEMEKADGELSMLAARIEGIKFHIRSLENNVALLNSLRIQFSQNIDMLKSRFIVTSLSEYGKIREDLRTVNNRLNIMQIDFNNHTIMLERAEKHLFECREKYVILLKECDGRVIKGNFGGKK